VGINIFYTLLLFISIIYFFSCVTFPSEDWEIADSTVQFWYFIKLSYNPYGLSYLSCHPPIRGIFSGCSLSSDLILSFLILGQLLRHIYLA